MTQKTAGEPVFDQHPQETGAHARSLTAEPAATDGKTRVRRRFTVSGTVQGIGFRPHVWRLASARGLAGFVRNVPAGVVVELEGPEHLVVDFPDRLAASAPVGARIQDIKVTRRRCIGSTGFTVIPSASGRARTLIPPDLATCPACLAEISNPADRRFRYPFTNCTVCGPRFTVVESLPYDRSTTTLRSFVLCRDCAREYHDPSDRRFRAEPIACPSCGPRVWLEHRSGSPGGQTQRGTAHGASHIKTPRVAAEPDDIAQAAALLQRGAVVAVQGLGGVHLACDATNDEAVRRLRTIKQRPHKPLAIMAASIDQAEELTVLTGAERTLLMSAHAPIVLLPRRPDTQLAPAVAPGNDHVGLMLAYSPLHHLLLRDVGSPLVMTSANRPGEPLARTPDEARAGFAETVDALLLHDRPIHQRCDDGVWMVSAHGPLSIRLSRGSVPDPVAVPVTTHDPILGVGGDIKNSFCLLADNHAFISQYIGTMDQAATREYFRDSLEKWKRLTGLRPRVAAHDLHPAGAARLVAEGLGLPTVGVQHHHAHIAACLAEHGRNGPAIGIAFDGTGYGSDGAIWGGEMLVADLASFRRVVQLQYLPLPGGDTAIRHPARIAAAYLLALFGEIPHQPLRAALGEVYLRILRRMIEGHVNTVPTSSCGRLFDAVAALLGFAHDVTYEAQAAIELETTARQSSATEPPYPFGLAASVIQLRPMFSAILADQRRDVPTAIIARRFHHTVAEMVRRGAALVRAQTALATVALSGGCFQNRLLLEMCVELLEAEGFVVLVPYCVPTNDGGLSLGQAVVAAARAQRG